MPLPALANSLVPYLPFKTDNFIRDFIKQGISYYQRFLKQGISLSGISLSKGILLKRKALWVLYRIVPFTFLIDYYVKYENHLLG